MPQLPLYQVDAFTDRPFAGNPAAVCPLEAALPEALMQDIAAENNLAETAFFQPQGDAFSLRWFTPTVEVDLCGHATLASAFVLFTELEPGRSEVTFRTRSGLLGVARGADGELVMDFPALPCAPSDAQTAADVRRFLSASAEPVEVLRVPNGTLVAVLASADEIRRAAPDLAAVAKTGAALCITARADAAGVDFVSRYFAPAHGIPEDPVTGSSFCFLAPLWAARLGKPSLRARQVSRRGGEVSCGLAGDRVRIGGKARLVLTGTLSF